MNVVIDDVCSKGTELRIAFEPLRHLVAVPESKVHFTQQTKRERERERSFRAFGSEF